MLVHSAPQIVQDTADANEHLIQVPRISRPWPASFRPPSKVAAEISAAEPNALVGHYDTPLGEDQLDVV